MEVVLDLGGAADGDLKVGVVRERTLLGGEDGSVGVQSGVVFARAEAALQYHAASGEIVWLPAVGVGVSVVADEVRAGDGQPVAGRDGFEAVPVVPFPALGVLRPVAVDVGIAPGRGRRVNQ